MRGHFIPFFPLFFYITAFYQIPRSTTNYGFFNQCPQSTTSFSNGQRPSAGEEQRRVINTENERDQPLEKKVHGVARSDKCSSGVFIFRQKGGGGCWCADGFLALAFPVHREAWYALALFCFCYLGFSVPLLKIGAIQHRFITSAIHLVFPHFIVACFWHHSANWIKEER